MKRNLYLFSIILVILLGGCLFSACNSNITLTITFDSNGGSSCNAIEYVVGKDFKMPPNPTRENYIFDGWYEDNGIWEKPFTENNVLNYELSRNMEIILYAKWKANERIVLHKNNGEENEIYYINGDIELTAPTKGHSLFLGWSIDEESQYITSLVEFNPNSFNLGADNKIDIYAVWADVDSISVVESSLKTTYYWGEEIGLTNAKLEIFYKKAMGSKVIPLTSDMIKNFNTRQYYPHIALNPQTDLWSKPSSEYTIDNKYTAQISLDDVSCEFDYYVVPEFKFCKVIETTLKKNFAFDEKFVISSQDSITLEIEYNNGEKERLITHVGNIEIKGNNISRPINFQTGGDGKRYLIETYFVNFTTSLDGTICAELYYHNYKLDYEYKVEERAIKSYQLDIDEIWQYDENITLENKILHIEYENNTGEKIIISKSNIIEDIDTRNAGDFKAKIINRKRAIEINYSVRESSEFFTYGLKFKLKDNDKYSVVGYDGTEQNVIVPSFYKGKAVDNLEEINSSVITSLTLPNTLLSAKESSLKNCPNIINISFNENLRVDDFLILFQQYRHTYLFDDISYIVTFSLTSDELYSNLCEQSGGETELEYKPSLITTYLLFGSKVVVPDKNNMGGLVGGGNQLDCGKKIMEISVLCECEDFSLHTRYSKTFDFYSKIPSAVTINNVLYEIGEN